ncbi:MAG: DUF89 family protein [Marinilabiliaceae bacterium]|nr:DUF89 family protein [Marinilabiliaceae bacterium]
MRSECYFCHIKTIQTLIEKYKPDCETAEELIFTVNDLLRENKEMSNPLLATDIHRIAKEKINNADLYAEEKKIANNLLISNYTYWKKKITDSDNPFKMAAKLAVVGNIIDYGAHSVSNNIIDQIEGLCLKQLKINQTDELQIAIKKAKSILYIGDNAGEIFFDRLFIEALQHPNITFVTRGKPVINDITIDDAKQVGIDKLCNVISNGFDAPSTILEFCSDEFMYEYCNADLIISKGQGNFEGLMDEKHPNTFFMLIAKCNPIANLLRVNKGDMVITKLT